jgi:HK97 family phage portal protein
MNLLQRLAQTLGFGGAGEVCPQNSTYSQDVMDSFGTGMGSAASAGMPVTALSAMRVAAVFACVQKIAGAIATLPLHQYRTDGDIKARLARDELWYKLNEQPSSQFTAASHWEGVSIGQLLRGDAYTWIRRALNGSVRELLPLPHGAVSPMRQTDGSVRYYLSLPEYGITTWLDGADLLHFPGFGFNGLHSMSVISYAARNAVGNALAMDDYSGKFFANGAHPSMILSAQGKMNPEQIANLQNAFASKYAGLDNAHRIPLVLTEGLTASPITLSAQDAQLLEARKFQVIDIARAFGVPPHMIGETSASTSWGSGIESMSRGFVTYTLQPHLVRIEQELNRKLFPRNTGRFVQFDRDALIEGDSSAQAAYNRAALGGPGTGMGWMSVDEVRKTKGMGPLGGAAGEVFDPRSLQTPQASPDATQQEAAVANTMAAVADVTHALRELRHAHEVHAVRISAQLEAAPAPAPVFHIAAPAIHVENKLPSPEAPVIHTTVNVPETNVHVQALMPEQAAPIVHNTVNLPETNVHIEAVMPEQAAPVVHNTVNLPETSIHVEALMPAQAAPVVHNTVLVEKPDPLTVNIAPQVVNIAPQVVNVAPTEVVVSLPARKTDTTLIRDSQGQITRATQIERDV